MKRHLEKLPLSKVEVTQSEVLPKGKMRDIIGKGSRYYCCTIVCSVDHYICNYDISALYDEFGDKCPGGYMLGECNVF